MASFLEGSLAKTVFKSLSPIFYSATLIRDVTAPASPDTPFNPTVTGQSTFTCKAIVNTYSNFYRLNELVKAEDRRIIILAQSLSTTPVVGDRVTIRGQTFKVLNVTTDPALATWELQGRIV